MSTCYITVGTALYYL